MLLFSSAEAVALTWDRHGKVCGLRLQKRGGIMSIGNAACCNPAEGEPLSVSLAKVWEKLSPEPESSLLLGGYLPSAVCIEFLMPKLPQAELSNAIAYELPRRLPTPLENLEWHYRITGEICKNGVSFWSCRVFAVQARDWMHMISEIDAAKLQPDMIVSPFMAAQLDGESVSLPGIEDFFEMVHSARGDTLPQMVSSPQAPSAPSITASQEEKYAKLPGWQLLENSLPSDERAKAFVFFHPALLLAEYGLRDCFRRDLKMAIPLPEKFRPLRSKGLKVACLFLSVSALILFMSYTGRAWWDARSRFAALRAEKKNISRQIKKIVEENTKNKQLDLTIKNIYGANPGNPEILQCLHYLSQNIPDGMWVIDFNSTNEKIEMTIKTSGEASDTEFSALAQTPFFSTENIRKRRNSDGSTDIFIRLLYANSKEGEPAAAPPLPPASTGGPKNG